MSISAGHQPDVSVPMLHQAEVPHSTFALSKLSGIIGFMMRKLCVLFLLAASASLGVAHPAVRARTPIRLPEVPGYVTLKGDFHLHTVFSDGDVWPTVRVEEAWRDGLDAIAITDHIEYQPHKADVTTNHNRAYEVAVPAGNNLEIIVVKGSEITRAMPPGHLNAIFLKDSSALAVPEWRDALSAAHKQEAFIFWNHPGWEAQAPEGKAVWFPEHTELLQKGMMHGIEIVNERDYYPEAHRWALEHNLTMLSNSDQHKPIGMDYPEHAHPRPVTLVFAKERSAAGVREALFARRTAVLSEGRLIGDEQFLRPIFQRSIKILAPIYDKSKGGRRFLQVQNDSTFLFELERASAAPGINAPRSVLLAPGKIVIMDVNAKKEASSFTAEYHVKNLLIGPDKPLKVTFDLEKGFTTD
jgi:hypothetical protein